MAHQYDDVIPAKKKFVGPKSAPSSHCGRPLWHGNAKPLYTGHRDVHVLYPVSLSTSVEELTPCRMSAELVTVTP